MTEVEGTKQGIREYLTPTTLVLTVIGLALSFWILRENPVLDLTLSVPAEVEVGSAISMIVKVTNPHTIPVTLDSVDIDDSFLSGFQVISIYPEAAKAHHAPFLKQRRWDFSKSVLPGESFTVTFTLKSVAEGNFFGDVDIANPSQDFTTVLADVVAQKCISIELPQWLGSGIVHYYWLHHIVFDAFKLKSFP